MERGTESLKVLQKEDFISLLSNHANIYVFYSPLQSFKIILIVFSFFKLLHACVVIQSIDDKYIAGNVADPDLYGQYVRTLRCEKISAPA